MDNSSTDPPAVVVRSLLKLLNVRHDVEGVEFAEIPFVDRSQSVRYFRRGGIRVVRANEAHFSGYGQPEPGSSLENRRVQLTPEVPLEFQRSGKTNAPRGFRKLGCS